MNVCDMLYIDMHAFEGQKYSDPNIPNVCFCLFVNVEIFFNNKDWNLLAEGTKVGRRTLKIHSVSGSRVDLDHA